MEYVSPIGASILLVLSQFSLRHELEARASEVLRRNIHFQKNLASMEKPAVRQVFVLFF